MKKQIYWRCNHCNRLLSIIENDGEQNMKTTQKCSSCKSLCSIEINGNIIKNTTEIKKQKKLDIFLKVVYY